MTTRPVKVQLIGKTWFVLYVFRRKHQRHSAAQFDATSHSADSVKAWIARQPNLTLNPENMTTCFEITPMLDSERRTVDRIATELLTKKPETRSAAAEIVRSHGMSAYIGGHHVAIHRPSSHVARMGERLALVTHDAPDWK